jgi:hypothetical protein
MLRLPQWTESSANQVSFIAMAQTRRSLDCFVATRRAGQKKMPAVSAAGWKPMIQRFSQQRHDDGLHLCWMTFIAEQSGIGAWVAVCRVLKVKLQ